MGAKARRREDSKEKGGAKRRGKRRGEAQRHRGGQQSGRFLPLKVTSGPWGEALHMGVSYGTALGLLEWGGPLRSPIQSPSR